MLTKKIIFPILIFLCLLLGINQAIAAEKTAVYFFWGDGCPHCAEEKTFLEELKQRYPEVKIYDYEVWESKKNRQLLIDFGKQLNVNVSGVPFTVVGEKHFVGWMSEGTTGKQIEEAIGCVQKNNCRDIGREIALLQNQNNKKEEAKEDCDCQEDDKASPIPQKIDVPIIGQIETKNLSLPLFTIVLGALDGFNPCAMWALLFLISLLLGMKDRKRMWILGTAFIVASASVYFVFMAAWLNLILFIGLVVWVRVIIGLIALAGGGYNLKEYFSSPDAGCKIANTEKRQKIFEKLKNITHQRNFYLALGGIILLAFAVNLVELICSAGLPAVYTQVLALSNLAKWQYYLYVLLYIFIFMLDDLFIFFVAMTTLKMTGITTKYSRWSHLIGGILMVIIGLLLLFKYEWLMFG